MESISWFQIRYPQSTLTGRRIRSLSYYYGTTEAHVSDNFEIANAIRSSAKRGLMRVKYANGPVYLEMRTIATTSATIFNAEFKFRGNVICRMSFYLNLATEGEYRVRQLLELFGVANLVSLKGDELERLMPRNFPKELLELIAVDLY
jgi:hypothetical protein